MHRDTIVKIAKYMFKKYPGFARALIHYRRGEYQKGLQELMQFIKQNKKLLHLELVVVKNNLVNEYLNDYRKKNKTNHSVIRNEEQLCKQISTLKQRGNNDKVIYLKKLVGIIKKKKRPLLIIDKISNKKQFLEAMIHELNAWIISDCIEPKKGLECMVGDWRRFLPKDGSLSQLDAYFFNK